MDYSDVAYEVSESIATITINRPERLNTFRGRTIEELIHAFKRAWADRAVACVILTGAGQKAFCVGGDQKEMQEKGSYGTSTNGLWEIDELHNVIRDIPKPVIAAVNGFAIGGGHVLHVLCDVTVAAEHAKFGQAGPRVGVVRCRLGLRLPRAHRRREACPGDLVLLPAVQRADGPGVGSRQPRGARRAPDGGGARPRQASRGSSPTALKFLKHAFNADWPTSSVRRRWPPMALRLSSTARRQSRRAVPSWRSVPRLLEVPLRQRHGTGRETSWREPREPPGLPVPHAWARRLDAPALEAYLRHNLDGFRGRWGSGSSAGDSRTRPICWRHPTGAMSCAGVRPAYPSMRGTPSTESIGC